MKRTPLLRKTPLRANHSGSRKRPAPTAYKSRVRDTAYMLWVKTRPCMVARLAAVGLLYREFPSHVHDARAKTPCDGVIEADHKSSGALSRKSADTTCIPLCKLHHIERTDHTGTFKHYKQADMRAFVATAIQLTHNDARAAGIEIPDGATKG